MKPTHLDSLNDNGIKLLAATVVANAADEYRALEARGLVKDGKPTPLAREVLRYRHSKGGHNATRRISNHIHIGDTGIKELVGFLKSKAVDFYLTAAGFDHSGASVRRALHLHA